MSGRPAHNCLPKPADFRAIYVACGWAGIRDRYGVGSATITRWVDEEGRDSLYAEREAYLARVNGHMLAARRHVAALGTATGLQSDAVHALHAADRATLLGTSDLQQRRHERLRG